MIDDDTKCYLCKKQSSKLHKIYNVVYMTNIYLCEDCYKGVAERRRKYAKDATQKMYAAMAVDSQEAYLGWMHKQGANQRMLDRTNKAMRFIPGWRGREGE